MFVILSGGEAGVRDLTSVGSVDEADWAALDARGRHDPIFCNSGA